jgi:hypothetical protein
MRDDPVMVKKIGMLADIKISIEQKQILAQQWHISAGRTKSDFLTI